MVDARLADGSRVNAIIPPLSLTGPVLTIRKFAANPFTIRDLIGFGTLTPRMAAYFKICVESRRNVIISGGTGSGKTTLLNVLSAYVPRQERIVTIEDAAELKLPQEHIVSLEAKPPNIENKGAIPIRQLVINSLRMRPDRIIVGECRGAEALDMLQAMNTGHDGSLTTIHANSPRDCLSRLETLVLMAGMELPTRAIRDQVASAINMIIQIARQSDGKRRIISITEITGMEQDIITLQEIFKFDQTGLGPKGEVIGEHKPTGAIPAFVHDLRRRGHEIDLSMFAAPQGPA
jgi:pilus assembly protein CpaF